MNKAKSILLFFFHIFALLLLFSQNVCALRRRAHILCFKKTSSTQVSCAKFAYVRMHEPYVKLSAAYRILLCIGFCEFFSFTEHNLSQFFFF